MEVVIKIPEYCKCPCKHCRNNIEFPREGLGLIINCPHCNREITLFDADESKKPADQQVPPVLAEIQPVIKNQQVEAPVSLPESSAPTTSNIASAIRSKFEGFFYPENPQQSEAAPQFYQQKKQDLRWVGPNETVEIFGHKITDGMFYVCNGNLADIEASAINTRLPAGKPVSGPAAELGYFSQYKWISPDQRATYLAWLASGRTDPDPSNRDLGYLFLYFYGLERRLLLDKSQEQEPIAELVRLLTVYGPCTRSRSLQSYFGQLIHFWGWNQGVDYYLKLMAWMRTLPVSLLGSDEMAIVLAGHFSSQSRVPADLVYTLTSRLEDSRRSVIISRVNEEFRNLFTKRYLEQFPGGLLLERSKRNTRLDYRPASPSLLQYGTPSYSISVPDILGLSSQFKPLSKIWNACVEDLSGYSKAKAKTTSDGKSNLDAYLALPVELRGNTAHPLADSWSKIYNQARQSNGGVIIDAGEAAQLIDLPERNKLTITQCRQLVEVIESLGFTIEPDGRHDGSYAWDQPVAIFKPLAGLRGEPSKLFVGAATLLKLCAIIAGSDGQISTEEMQVARRFIERNLAMDAGDQQRLEMLEQLLILDPSAAKGSLARLAKNVPVEQREKICEVLVYVAAADNIVTKDELRALKQIFKAFELPEDRLNEKLKSIRPEFGEVTIETVGNRVPGEAIPKPPSSFKIDLSQVDRIAQETAEVIGILAKVMVDDDPQTEVDQKAKRPLEPRTPATTDQPTTSKIKTVPDWLATLDVKYHDVLLRIVERVSWPRAEFNALAGNFRLMPLDAHDAINEWADEHLGDFLLEGEDPILIRKELINDRD